MHCAELWWELNMICGNEENNDYVIEHDKEYPTMHCSLGFPHMQSVIGKISVCGNGFKLHCGIVLNMLYWYNYTVLNRLELVALTTWLRAQFTPTEFKSEDFRQLYQYMNMYDKSPFILFILKICQTWLRIGLKSINNIYRFENFVCCFWISPLFDNKKTTLISDTL